MTEIRFYHLQKQSLDQALPLILEKAYSMGHKIIVKMQDEEEANRMATHLWTYRQDKFLPHGSKKDGQADLQPIWITPLEENPNAATILILTQGQTSENIEKFDLVCEMLNGHSDDQIAAARKRWAEYQKSDYKTTYWFQNEDGGWVKKA